MRCTSCGSELPSEARFCLHCGSQVVPASAQPPGTRDLEDPGASAYAAPWRRIGAAVIDLAWLIPRLFLLLVAAVLVSWVVSGDPEFQSEAERLTWAGVYMLVLLSGALGGLACLEGADQQGTVGKLVLGFGVATTKGGRVGFGRALMRRLLMLPLWPFAIFMPLTRNRQCLHDRLAGCVMPRLDQQAEQRRTAFLKYWMTDEFWGIFWAMLIGVVTIPIGVGVVILLVWSVRFLRFRAEAKRLFREIRRPAAVRSLR